MTKRKLSPSPTKLSTKRAKPNTVLQICGIDFAIDTLGHVVQYLSPWFIVDSLFLVCKSFHQVLETNVHGLWYNVWINYRQHELYEDLEIYKDHVESFVKFANNTGMGFEAPVGKIVLDGTKGSFLLIQNWNPINIKKLKLYGDNFTQEIFEQLLDMPFVKNLEHLSITREDTPEPISPNGPKLVTETNHQNMNNLKSLSMCLDEKNQNMILSLCPPTLQTLKLKIDGKKFYQSPSIDNNIASKFRLLRRYESFFCDTTSVDEMILYNNHETLEVVRINNSCNFEEFWLKKCFEYPVLKKLTIGARLHDRYKFLSAQFIDELHQNYTTWLPQITTLKHCDWLSVEMLSTESTLIDFDVVAESLEELYQLLSYPHNKKWRHVSIVILVPITLKNLLDMFFCFYHQPFVGWKLRGGILKPMSDDIIQIFDNILEYKVALNTAIRTIGGYDNHLIKLVCDEVESYAKSDLWFIDNCCENKRCKKKYPNIPRLCPKEFFDSDVEQEQRNNFIYMAGSICSRE
jgi:hypothetical protein